MGYQAYPSSAAWVPFPQKCAKGGTRGRGGIAPTHSSALDGGVVSVMPWPTLYSWERTPGNLWIGGWVGLRAGLNRG
jgi:hypothetical protein